MPLVGSPLIGNADFGSSYLADPFFEITTYSGAFGTIDWTANWTDFDCQNTVYIITGIEENTNIKNVNIYPNPATANSMVSFQTSKSSSNTINIYDMQGKLVEAVFVGHLNAGKQNVNFTAEKLSPGFYILNISDENGASNHRLIVK